MNMKKKALKLVCVTSILSAWATQPPAQTIEECKRRAATARRRCEIAYYSACIAEAENTYTCKASSIDFDCSKIENEVYTQELEAMNREHSKSVKNRFPVRRADE